jgi:hypothetical protein
LRVAVLWLRLSVPAYVFVLQRRSSNCIAVEEIIFSLRRLWIHAILVYGNLVACSEMRMLARLVA